MLIQFIKVLFTRTNSVAMRSLVYRAYVSQTQEGKSCLHSV